MFYRGYKKSKFFAAPAATAAGSLCRAGRAGVSALITALFVGEKL